MTKKLHVACSALTNNIYAGSVSKDGKTWLSNKTDVTNEAIGAVCEHVERAGGAVTVNCNGVPLYEVTVTKIVELQPKDTQQ